MEKLLSEVITQQVSQVFADLPNEVQLVLFTSQNDCEFCPEARQLLGELAELSDKISFVEYDFEQEADLAADYKIDKVPGLLVMAKEDDGRTIDYGIRFFGMPSGHEFSTLVNDVVMVSSRNSGLSDETRAFLMGLDQPVHLQVFVTPTCPYCPRAVVLAHQMAMESPLVESEGVEAMEYPELADQFQVSSVPHTSINHGVGEVIGAFPEDHLVNEIKKTLAASSPA